MIVQDLVTIDSLCTFHVMHITTYICTEVNKENIYIILRADRQITKMIRINQALQLYNWHHTFNYWNCIHIKIYALHFIIDWYILVTWYLSPHHPQQKELCFTDVWKLHQNSSLSEWGALIWDSPSFTRRTQSFTPPSGPSSLHGSACCTNFITSMM